jgi:hypothetical protein
MWKVDDITLQWLKVSNNAGRIYFVPWTQDPELLPLHVLTIIPADPAESANLTLTVPAGELPGWERKRVVTPAFRQQELAKLWQRERRKLEKQGSLEPLPVPIHKCAT